MSDSSAAPTGFPPSFHFNFNSTLGADFIGLLLSAIFYGVTVLQTIIYFSTYPNDRWPLKLLVGCLWALDTASLTLFAHGTYTYVITDFANPAAAATLIWSIASEPMITAVISLIVHWFLALRIRNLNPARVWTWIGAIIAVLSLFPFAIGTYTIWLVNSGTESLVALGELRWVAIAGDSSSSAIDLAIAVTICCQLYMGRRGGIKSTNKLIQILSLYVVSSGVITTVLNMTTMITYLASPNTFIFQAFSASGSKAYVNTLMATLNIRETVRKNNTPTVIGLGESNVLRFRGATTGSNTVPDSEYGLPLEEMNTHVSTKRDVSL
ncbi:hypothetical protein C8J56DRAFT_992957 [Mycena floridula]|nr:hypothetical protein C8J56DRAFT_992957 [Mycena floridula]